MIPSFKTYFYQVFLEMAMPSDDMTGIHWYHGTNQESITEILKTMILEPSKIITSKTKARMAPMFGKVYITSDISTGIGYAFFRSGSHLNFEYPSPKKEGFAYLVIIDGGDLADIDPDEDAIAEIIPAYVKNDNEQHPFPWLRRLAERYAPKSLSNYDRHGDFSYGTKLGKILIKYLTDNQKLQLIRYHKNAAHSGNIPVKEIWKLDLSRREEYKNNPLGFRNISERLK
jgi:hypothetical protein